MVLQISIWISLCLVVMFGTLVMLRRDRLSLGMPFAFVALIVINHVPGALVYVLDEYFSTHITAVARGIKLTAVALVAFFFGVWVARALVKMRQERAAAVGKERGPAGPRLPTKRRRDGPRFWLFCLTGGWLLYYCFAALLQIPSLGAAIDKGSAVWILGVMLALQNALVRRDAAKAAMWASTVLIFSALSLVLAGFLSSASTVAILILAFLAITSKRVSRVVLTICIVSVVGLTVFVNYMGSRDQIRLSVWGGDSLSQRLDVVGKVVGELKFFDPKDYRHLSALDRRLNQGYFIGVAAERLDTGDADYLKGRSVSDGLLSLIPRAIWPEKPVYGGSGTLVIDATGLDLSRTTAWGVGSIMEIYINFGLYGMISGFILLGAVIGALDRKATIALCTGRTSDVFLYFLPCAALIQPLGSLVELASGAAAATAASFLWRYAWIIFNQNFVSQPVSPLATQFQRR